jgi:hypothetical protein
MTTNEWEAIYPDGSIAQPGVRAGGMAVNSLALFIAIQALEVWLKEADRGKPAKERWQTTRNGHRKAILNIIEPMTGRQFASASGRCTDKACREALAAAKQLLADIEASRVIYVTDETGPNRATEEE